MNTIVSTTFFLLHTFQFYFKFIFCDRIKKEAGLIITFEIFLKTIIIITFDLICQIRTNINEIVIEIVNYGFGVIYI
jgi:hypothetical protein